MRTKKDIWKKAGVLVLATVLVTVVFAGNINAEKPKQRYTARIYDYENIWDDEYYNGFSGMDVAIDGDKDAVVVGVGQYGEGVVVKYDGETGDVLWNNVVADDVLNLNQNPLLSGDDYSDYYCIRDFLTEIKDIKMGHETDVQFQVQMVSVDTDSNKDIFAVATAYDISDDDCPSVVYIVKYDSDDGLVIWEKLIDVCVWDFTFGVAVDENDDAVIAGVSGGVDLGLEIPLPIMDGWVLKLDGDDGDYIWSDHIFGILQPLPYYFDVDTDSNNDVFATGLAIVINWTDFPNNISNIGQTAILNKFDGDNHQLLNTYLGILDTYEWAWTVTVDKDDFVYMGGSINLPDTYKHILKFTNNLEDIEWSLIDRYLINGWVNSLATMDNGNVVSTTDKLFSTEGGDCFYTEIFSPNGHLLLEIIEGGDWEGSRILANGMGVATDSDDNVIVTGYREDYNAETIYMYTMKYHVTKGFSFEIPESYLLD